MGGPGFEPKKSFSHWLPVVSLLLIILVLGTLISAFFAGGQGLDGLWLVVSMILLLARLIVIAFFFTPLFLAFIAIYFGYTLLIKKKQQPGKTQNQEQGSTD